MFKSNIFYIILIMISSYSNADHKKGEQLYNMVCFTCHGPHMEGGMGPSLIDPYWKHGDSLKEIAKTISEGVYDSDMVAFKNTFSQEDINSLAGYILSKQQGLRSVKRFAYEDSTVNGKIDPESFNQAKVLKIFNHPENVIYHDFHPSQVSKIEGLLYIPQDDTFYFDFQTVRLEGQVSIYIGSEEYFNFESKRNTPKHKSTSFPLKAGVHKFTLYHQKISKHKLRRQHIFADLNSTSGLKIKLFGDSMIGASPKVITAGTRAKVIRKNVQGLSPRSVIAVLPNKVILAINTEHAGLEKAWHSAKIDLTKSIMLRGRDAATISGKEIPSPIGRINRVGYTGQVQYLASQVQGENLVIEYKIGHVPYSITYSPYGAHGYKVHVSSNSRNNELEVYLATPMELNGHQREGLIQLSEETARNFTMRQGE